MKAQSRPGVHCKVQGNRGHIARPCLTHETEEQNELVPRSYAGWRVVTRASAQAFGVDPAP